MSENSDIGGEPPCWAHLVDDLETDRPPPERQPWTIPAVTPAGGAEGPVG